MTTRRVNFFKNLLSSDGHPFKVLQRVVTVSDVSDPADLVCAAQQQFAQLEDVTDWRLHADWCEAALDQ